MMRDTTWTLHVETPTGEDAIVTSGLEGETPTVEPGTELTTELVFEPRDGVGEPFYERYNRLVPYLQAPKGAVARRGISDVSVPWIRERYGEQYPVESLLVGVEPGEDVIDAHGWWGLLVGGGDTSQPVSETSGLRRVSCQWFVLSRFGEYSSHEAVRNALADEISRP